MNRSNLYMAISQQKNDFMKNTAQKFLTILFVLFQIVVPSQNEFSKWYFGQYAGLDFSTTPPTALTNGSLITSEGVATISDANGNLLFYTDGVTIRNSSHSVMANGTGLGGNASSTQSGIIVKQPGNTNVFYVFTAYNTIGVNYSKVDMNLAAGLGSVTVKNATLHAPTCEKLVALNTVMVKIFGS